MEDSFLKVKYDKLVFELKFLEADLHYHDSILKKGSGEFESQCRSAIKDLGLEKVFYGDKSAAENYAKKESKIEQESAKKIKPSDDGLLGLAMTFVGLFFVGLFAVIISELRYL